MVGVQEDRKLFCVREESAEVFDGSGLKQKAKKKGKPLRSGIAISGNRV